MDAPPLPLTQRFDFEGVPMRCPWCWSHAIGEATLTLDALYAAHRYAMLEEPTREFTGAAPPDALTIDCPDCGHPSMIALVTAEQGQAELSLIPVRTGHDVELLARP